MAALSNVDVIFLVATPFIAWFGGLWVASAFDGEDQKVERRWVFWLTFSAVTATTVVKVLSPEL